MNEKQQCPYLDTTMDELYTRGIISGKGLELIQSFSIEFVSDFLRAYPNREDLSELPVDDPTMLDGFSFLYQTTPLEFSPESIGLPQGVLSPFWNHIVGSYTHLFPESLEKNGSITGLAGLHAAILRTGHKPLNTLIRKNETDGRHLSNIGMWEFVNAVASYEGEMTAREQLIVKRYQTIILYLKKVFGLRNLMQAVKDTHLEGMQRFFQEQYKFLLHVCTDEATYKEKIISYPSYNDILILYSEKYNGITRTNGEADAFGNVVRCFYEIYERTKDASLEDMLRMCPWSVPDYLTRVDCNKIRRFFRKTGSLPLLYIIERYLLSEPHAMESLPSSIEFTFPCCTPDSFSRYDSLLDIDLQKKRSFWKQWVDAESLSMSYSQFMYLLSHHKDISQVTFRGCTLHVCVRHICPDTVMKIMNGLQRESESIRLHSIDFTMDALSGGSGQSLNEMERQAVFSLNERTLQIPVNKDGSFHIVRRQPPITDMVYRLLEERKVPLTYQELLCSIHEITPGLYRINNIKTLMDLIASDGRFFLYKNGINYVCLNTWDSPSDVIRDLSVNILKDNSRQMNVNDLLMHLRATYREFSLNALKKTFLDDPLCRFQYVKYNIIALKETDDNHVTGQGTDNQSGEVDKEIGSIMEELQTFVKQYDRMPSISRVSSPSEIELARIILKYSSNRSRTSDDTIKPLRELLERYRNEHVCFNLNEVIFRDNCIEATAFVRKHGRLPAQTENITMYRWIKRFMLRKGPFNNSQDHYWKMFTDQVAEYGIDFGGRIKSVASDKPGVAARRDRSYDSLHHSTEKGSMVSQTIKELEAFVEKNGRMPFSTPLTGGLERILHVNVRTYLKSGANINKEEQKALIKVVENFRAQHICFTHDELYFKEKCMEMLELLDRDKVFPKYKDNVTLCGWFHKIKRRNKIFQDARDYYWNLVLEKLDELGIARN